MSKVCFKCGIEKPLSEFYKHSQMADGHVNKCKDCNKKDVRENRKKNLDYYRNYDRERGSRQSNDYKISYRERFPKKYYAHTVVESAVAKGMIIKPVKCECCGNEIEKEKLHGHHDDYDSPLDVRWLCASCHNEWHRINGEGKNAC